MMLRYTYIISIILNIISTEYCYMNIILYIIRYYAYAYMCCECGLFITLYSVVHIFINCHVVTVLCHTSYSRHGERDRVNNVLLKSLGGLTYRTYLCAGPGEKFKE